MSEIIYHNATITAIEADSVKVLIERGSACKACHNKSACNITHGKPMIYNIFTPNAHQFSIGEEVRVGISSRMGLKAVLYAYIIPLLLVIVSIMVCFLFCISELYQALIAIIVLAAYFLLLSRFKHRFCTQFNYSLEKLYNAEN